MSNFVKISTAVLRNKQDRVRIIEVSTSIILTKTKNKNPKNKQ